MRKVFSVLIFSVTFLTTACSVELGGSSTPTSDNERSHFFKATGGEQHEIFPLAGVRLYDNNTYAHIFRKDCDSDKNSVLQKVSSLSSGKSAQESPRIAGMAQSKALCGYDAEFFWENGKLVVRDGTLGFGPPQWHGDVEYTEIGQAEFFKLLKAQTQDKGFNYRTLPRDEREAFDDACKDLAGKNCSDFF